MVPVSRSVDELRSYLRAHNGIRGLEILEPSEVERAVRIFHRDGFVVVRNALTPEQLEFLKAGSDEAMRQIPGSQHSRASFPTLEEEPEWMRLSTVCPAPAGSVQIRDVRAWHGGTPNVSDHARAIPNLEFYAPWFREPAIPGITRADHRKISEHAQRLTRFLVADSADELRTGYTLTPPR